MLSTDGWNRTIDQSLMRALRYRCATSIFVGRDGIEPPLLQSHILFENRNIMLTNNPNETGYEKPTFQPPQIY